MHRTRVGASDRSWSVAYAAYEVTVLDQLAALGHPVPTVVDEPVEVDGSVVLMTRAPGTQGGYDTDDPRERGRQLAQLHQGLTQLPDLGQREGRQRPLSQLPH